MIKSNPKFKIVHLYAQEMNLYGDMGNILALQKILTDSGVEFDYRAVNNGDFWDGSADLIFMGGGQDSDQEKIYQDFLTKKGLLLKYLEDSGIMLAICGAYQLLGHEFVTADGQILSGLGFLPIKTRASGGIKERCIGNVAVLAGQWLGSYLEVNESIFLVGFENHGGQTVLDQNLVFDIDEETLHGSNSKNLQKTVSASTKIANQESSSTSPKQVQFLGKVLSGHGNSFNSGHEGMVYKGVVGTYLHGSCLPKNPELSIYLLLKAIEQKLQYLEEQTRNQEIQKSNLEAEKEHWMEKAGLIKKYNSPIALAAKKKILERIS